MTEEQVHTRKKKKHVNVSLPTPLLAYLSREANKLEVTRNEYIEHLVWHDFLMKQKERALHGGF